MRTNDQDGKPGTEEDPAGRRRRREDSSHVAHSVPTQGRRLADLRTSKWTGQPGREYMYWIYEIGTVFSAEPANYIFARERSAGNHEAVYVGQTGDLSERFDRHPVMPRIGLSGATHIHVHKNDDGRRARIAEQNDLIARWDPPCNRPG